MKTSLEHKLQQRLAMTPQLQQSIRLLQLPALDLQQEIQNALASNPLLEEEPASGSSPESDQTPEDAQLTTPPEHLAAAAAAEHESPPDDREESWAQAIPEDLPVDSGWEDIYPTSAPSCLASTDNNASLSSFTEAVGTLHTHLQWQLDLMRLSEKERLVAHAIVDGIDDNGYLSVPVADIETSLADTDRELVEPVLRLVQQLEPSGVGCRDLRECLRIQLEQLPDSPETREDRNNLFILIDKHIDLLGQRDNVQLKRRSGLAQDQLQSALKLLRTFTPHPGDRFQTLQVQYLVPDVIARRDRDSWRVELNPEVATRVRVNAHYATMASGASGRGAGSTDGNGKDGLAGQLREARWLIKSLRDRDDTLLRVARCIIEHQHDFMEQGAGAMCPLRLQDIAAATGLHESTVSRTTTNKFIHTPRGTFALKYFFSSQLSTTSGAACSSTAVRTLIGKLIREEDPAAPLSDSRITTLLSQQGINVARRTVAKYRESLALEPSHLRRCSVPKGAPVGDTC